MISVWSTPATGAAAGRGRSQQRADTAARWSGYGTGLSSQLDRKVLVELLARNADLTLRQLQTAMEE
jgi:hypothetical protein